ncbi:MAG: sigma-70 family RNA polymerase sigma factor [Phycisphaerae bacterium]
MANPTHEITRLLAAAGSGRREAWDELAPLIYDELKQLAEAAFRRERANHTLQPTALVHEAYVRLAGGEPGNWNNRVHFFGAAAQTMRRVLIQYARQRNAEKRGGGQTVQPLDELLIAFEDRSTDLLTLDAALERLAEMDPQQSQIVELRFFGGLTVEETAGVLGVSPSTVERGWRVARAWLLGEVSGA